MNKTIGIMSVLFSAMLFCGLMSYQAELDYIQKTDRLIKNIERQIQVNQSLKELL